MGPSSPLTESKAIQSTSLLGWIIDATERGWIPDLLVRLGMRRMLAQRLSSESSQDKELCLQDFLKATRAQPIALSTELANEQHYEVPAAFFQHVLGPRLKYSCCFWDETTQSLAQAEVRALELTCEHAQLEDGQSVLELGCGWGSLSLWMAEKYPQSRITAVSNSHSQREFIMQMARFRGLHNLQVITADINDFDTTDQFNRIVSVEMLEHVRNHYQLFERIDDWLSPDGKLFVHIFCHRDTPYLFHAFGESNWMGRYFFTGGMMPSFDLLPETVDQLNLDQLEFSIFLEQSWQWNGLHYAKTCRQWLQRQDDCADWITTLLIDVYGVKSAKRWFQRWRMFFMACEELFAYHGGNEWFVAHYLFSKSR